MGKEGGGTDRERQGERRREGEKETETQGEIEPQTGRGPRQRHRDRWRGRDKRTEKETTTERQQDVSQARRSQGWSPGKEALAPGADRHTMTFVPQAAQSWLEKHEYFSLLKQGRKWEGLGHWASGPRGMGGAEVGKGIPGWQKQPKGGEPGRG